MLQNEYYIDSHDIIFLLSSVVSDSWIYSIQFQTLCIKLSYFNGNVINWANVQDIYMYL
jgi:hypothetical protein